MAKEILTVEDYNNIVHNKESCAIKFGAVWCNPCKVMDKSIEEVSKNTAVNIYKVDIDKVPDLAGILGVMSVPTTFFVDAGEVVGKNVGAMSASGLKAELDKLV